MSKIAKIMQQAAAGAVGEALAIEDVFSTYLYTGTGAAQVIENGIRLGQSFGSGSVRFDGDQANSLSIATNAALDLAPGDFTIEMWVYPNRITNYQMLFDTSLDGSAGANMTELWISPSGNIQYYAKGSIILTSSATLSANNWYHIALVKSSGTDRLYVNGALSASVSSTTNPNTGYTWRIGDRIAGASAGQYPLQGNISNFRIVKGVGVYTSAFTPPTSNLTAISGTSLLICQGDNPFVDNSTNAFTITKNGDPQAKTFGPFDAAEAGEGGLVWFKARSGTYGTSQHALFDTDRGVLQGLASSLASAEATEAGSLTAFNSDGFNLGSWSGVNGSASPYASWTFRKAPRFFDVVTYTGNGVSGRSISHSLNCNVGTIIFKRTDSANDWIVWHRSAGGAYGFLNATDAFTANSGISNPTTTVFTIESTINAGWNASGGTYVAYLFAHDPLGPSGDGSDGLIACGSYTGNGSSATVSLGWEPQWILVKKASSAGAVSDWHIYDNMRGIATGGNDNYLRANLSDAEVANIVNNVELTATGFTANANIAISSETYIYIAIRRGPMREPTSGTEVFAPVTRNSSVGGVNYYTGFPVDLSIFNARNGPGNYFHTRLTATKRLQSVNTAAEISGDAVDFTSNVGYQPGTSSTTTNALTWNFRRAPGFFDVVCWTGDGTDKNITHQLGVVPEIVITKTRSTTGEWYTYVDLLWSSGDHKGLNVRSNAGASTTTVDGSGTFPYASTTTTFGVGGNSNLSGETKVAYLFATLPGVSKVGSYTGNGSSQTINCSFTGGARFVLIKRTDGGGDWYVWDTTRGIVSGNDPHLSLNTTVAEVTSDDTIDPDSSGFIVNQVLATNVNQSSASYIYLAIA